MAALGSPVLRRLERLDVSMNALAGSESEWLREAGQGVDDGAVAAARSSWRLRELDLHGNVALGDVGATAVAQAIGEGRMRQVELVDIRGCMFGREEEAVNAVAGWLLRRRRCGAASETVSGTGLSSMGVGECARQRWRLAIF